MQFILQSTWNELKEWWGFDNFQNDEFLSERRLKRAAKRFSKKVSNLLSNPQEEEEEWTEIPHYLSSVQIPERLSRPIQFYQIPRRNARFPSPPPPLFHSAFEEPQDENAVPLWQTAGTNFEIGPDGPSDDIDALCTICLEEFLPEQLVNRLPCMHTFHDRCLKSWLEVGSLTCPSCRAWAIA